MNKLKEKYDNFDILTLQNAAGTVVNMDYFPVRVTELPTGMTADEFLEEIRTNINDFVDTDLSGFSPEDEVETGTDETDLWESEEPIGAILHIEIPMDEGSVICSDYDSDQWKFSTIRAPWDYDHPVSGTREFGYT